MHHLPEYPSQHYLPTWRATEYPLSTRPRHQAVDLPGFGYTKTSVQSLKRSAEKDGSASLCTSELLVDIIKSLGKHYAFCIVASSEGAAAVFSALQERPNLASFLILKEPQVRGKRRSPAFEPTRRVDHAKDLPGLPPPLPSLQPSLPSSGA